MLRRTLRTVVNKKESFPAGLGPFFRWTIRVNTGHGRLIQPIRRTKLAEGRLFYLLLSARALDEQIRGKFEGPDAKEVASQPAHFKQ